MKNAREINDVRSVRLGLNLYGCFTGVKMGFWWLLLVCAFTFVQPVKAIITNAASNTAFQSGETVQYDLYYNWKFVWVKAGTATMSVTDTYYKTKPVYRTRLLTRGSEKADRFWVLRDTLTSYMTHDLLPVAYTKTDMEGTKYRQRYVWFTYKNGKTHIRQRYINHHGEERLKEEESAYTVYDMMSILMRARSLNAATLKKGDQIRFHMTDGHGISEQVLIYRGKKDVKMKNGDGTYRCLVVSFVEYVEGKEQEVGTFYVTDDSNHLPVAADLYLNIGAVKIYMTGYKHLKNPIQSKVK